MNVLLLMGVVELTSSSYISPLFNSTKMYLHARSPSRCREYTGEMIDHLSGLCGVEGPAWTGAVCGGQRDFTDKLTSGLC